MLDNALSWRQATLSIGCEVRYAQPQAPPALKCTLSRCEKLGWDGQGWWCQVVGGYVAQRVACVKACTSKTANVVGVCWGFAHSRLYDSQLNASKVVGEEH